MVMSVRSKRILLAVTIAHRCCSAWRYLPVCRLHSRECECINSEACGERVVSGDVAQSIWRGVPHIAAIDKDTVQMIMCIGSECVLLASAVIHRDTTAWRDLPIGTLDRRNSVGIDCERYVNCPIFCHVCNCVW